MADDGSIWAATSTGVLRIKDDNVVLKLDKSNALKYENITTLRVHEENVYLISNEGFQQYNTRSKKLKFYNELDGLPRGKVNDVEKLGGHIYVGMDRGLIRIPMEEDAINNLIPIAIISEVFVNEVSLNTVKDRIGLAYYENNIRIDISAIALRSLGQYTYQYRLKGIDEGWLTISSSNKSIRFPKLSDGSYKFQVKVLNDDGIESEVQSLEIRISPPFWKTWWFITSSIFGLGFITALIVYLRFQIINKQLRLEKALKNSEMKAIRAQMNPHFVFNALNSIQSLVLQKDYKNSNYYLGKFSNLVRIILMMSEQQKVTLQEEIEMLRLYLDLEKLRFDDINIKLVVEIETHEQEELVVPPMLTQPHVENALKHGLLHKKKGKKHISIRFSLLGDYVKIIIQDNGVGRKQRKKMQERSLKRHKSYSTEANIKRVELL
ncbi:MAG: sensor histidine kinase, partial [Saprospiraceae bacterium]